MRTWTGQALEVGERVQGHIHLARRPTELVAINFTEEFLREIALFDESDKSLPRVEAGRNDVGVDFIAIGENNALGLARLDDDICDPRLSTDFDASFAGSVSNRIRDCAGSSASKSPGAECAVDLAHVMVQQN